MLDYLTDGSVIPLVDRPVIAEAPIHVESKLSNTVLPQEAYLAELNKPIDPRSTYPIDLPPALQRAWFNAHNSVEDIAEREANGFVLATWRGERTASVVLKPATNSWVDMGAGGEKDNGKRDSGDALKLASLVTGRSQAELLYEARQEMLRDPEIIEKRSHRLRRMRITEPLAPPIKERITEPLPTPAEMGATFERVAPTAENGAAPNEGATVPCTDGEVERNATPVAQPCEDRLMEFSFPKYVSEKTEVWKAEKRSTSALPQGLRQIGDQTQFSLGDYLVRIGYVIAHGDSRERAVIVREMMLTHDRLEVLRAQGKPKQGKQKKKGAK